MTLEKGFSLFELLVCIAIIGIISAIAIPSYNEQVTRARRSDGKAALLEVAQRVERYFSNNYSYDGAAQELGLPQDSSLGYYHIDIKVPDPHTGKGFLLTATPQKGQEVSDRDCQSLTYNDIGIEQISSGPLGSPKSSALLCWS